MCRSSVDEIMKHAPCYVYDSGDIRNNCERLTQSLPQVNFLYSIKTNPFDPVVKIMAEQGFGADASSVGEVLKAEAAGIHPGRIFYSTPGKTAEDIEETYGKCVYIADSIHELELLDKAADAHGEILPIGVRINPRAGFKDNEGSSKFGIDEELLFSPDADLGRFEHLIISGIHVHLMSQILDAGSLSLYYERCFELALRCSKLQNADISFINFGSGIGMVYDEQCQAEVDLDRLASAFEKICKRNAETLGADLFIETGRFVTGNAGKYYTVVTDIKESRGVRYLIVKNALNGFLRPVMAQLLKAALGEYPVQGMEPLYTCANEVSVRVLNDAQEKETVMIAGDLCTSQDVIIRDAEVNKAGIGDLVEITNAGSYGFTLSPILFAGHDAPDQIVI